MMSVRQVNSVHLRLSIFLFSVFVLSPDPVFSANLLDNPGFETGDTSGWSPFGGDTIAATAAVAHTGSYSASVTDRTQPWNGIAQTLLGRVSNNEICSISGWARIQNAASANIKLTIAQTEDGVTSYHNIASKTVTDNDWTELSGFFTLQVSGALTGLTLYFEGPEAGVNFYVDDVIVAGDIVADDWQGQADQRIDQIRKGNFRVTAVNPNNPTTAVADVEIQVNQTRMYFPFGSAITDTQMTNPDYLDFFENHYEWAVMTNASKWYANEPSQDYVTYANADIIYDFCSSNNITMRGHCIFWASENMVQDWIKDLSYAALPAASQLRTAVENRLTSVVNHFKDKFVHWDVNNEMCKNSFFKDRLGTDIRPWMFQATNAIDPNVMLFLNDYNVISNGYNLNIYKQMAYDLAAQGAIIDGLGVQCHMNSSFDPVTIKDRFDSVAEVNLPIWVTEFDVQDPDEYIRADKLEEFYRVAFSHPAVEGILMWGFWENAHWRENCHLVNADWTLNAAGVRYEALMEEWTTRETEIADVNGNADFRGFYGTYTITLTPQGDIPTTAIVEITPDGETEFAVALTGSVPSAPVNLTASAANQSVFLQWDDNTDSDLAGYNVYRSTVPGTGYTKLNGTPLSVSEYTDINVVNYTNYFYVVTAVDIDSYESDVSNQVSATPYNGSLALLSSADFEQDINSWNNITGADSHDWTRHSGSTPSNNTGPDSGDDGSIWYMYLETSDGGANDAGDTAIMESQDVGGMERVLTFAYHMFGSEIGSLYVDVFDGIWHPAVWSVSGQQHTSSSEAYTTAAVDLGEYLGLIRIRFRGVAVGGIRGDMAIDAIKVTGIAVYGDFDYNNLVDADDFAEFSSHWLETDCVNLDLNGDCLINLYEFAEMAKNWLHPF